MQEAGTTLGGDAVRAPATHALSPAVIPARIGKYEVREEIGNGTLVRLFRATDRDTSRPVILKVLTDVRDQRLVQIFRREVANAARLRHRNLITIFELGEHEGLPFAAMQDLNCGDLRRTIQAQRPLTLLQKVTIMWQVGEGLKEAHNGGLNYVGIRPSGILLAEDRTAIIQDFNIVRLIGEELDEDLSYASPEELTAGSSPDALCDVFSFGVIYYEFLTGAHPFRDGMPTPLRVMAPECPEELDRLIGRALDKNRTRRYQSMNDLQEDAEPILCELKRARAAALLADARRMQASGEIEQAQSVMREVLELDPANRKARQIHAGLRAEQQSRMLRERLQALFQEADEEAAARRFARAVEILHSATQLYGSGPEVEQRLEHMCARLEQSQNAAQLLADARQLLVEENFAEARAKASEAHTLDPDSPGADELLGAIAEAVERREREARIDGELARADALVEEKAYDRAISVLLALRSEFPGSPAVDLGLARIEEQKIGHVRQIRLQEELGAIRSLMAEERFAEAIAKLAPLIEEFPTDLALPELLAQAQHATRRASTIELCRAGCDALRPLGEFEKAIEILDAAPAEYASDPALLALRRELEQERDAAAAAGAARTALAEAQWLLDQDRPHLAARFLREKAAALPDQPDLLERLHAIESIIPDWENSRFVKDCLSRAAILEQSEQWAVALTLIEQAIETCPDSQELLATADRLRSRRRQEERRKKLARRLESIQLKIGAESWVDAISLIEAAQAEFPGELELERRLEEARAGWQRTECHTIAAGVRQFLADGEPEKAEEVLRKGMQSLPAERVLVELWYELEAGKRYREQWRSAQVFLGRRQFREAEDILLPLAAENRPEAKALLEAVRAARAASGEEDFFDQSREQVLKLLEQHQYAQAAELIRNLLTLFPGDPMLTRDLQTAEAGMASAAAEAVAAEAGLASAAAEPVATEAPLESAPAKLVTAEPVTAEPVAAERVAAAPAAAARLAPAPVAAASSKAAPAPQPKPNFAVPASLAGTPRKEVFDRNRFLHRLLWPAIVVSVLLLLVSAGATVWKLSRNRAQAATEAPKDVKAKTPATVTARPPASKPFIGARAEVARPHPRIVPTVGRQPSNPPRFPAGADLTQAPPALPAPPPDALPGRQDAPRLPSDLVQVAPPPVPVKKPPEPQPVISRIPEPGAPNIQEPKVISHPTPAIPQLARQRGISGVVDVEAIVSPRGTVTQIKVLSGDPILAAAATAAIWNWRYEPGKFNGRAIPMNVLIRVSFEDQK